MKQLAVVALFLVACGDRTASPPPAPPASLTPPKPQQPASFAIPKSTKLLVTAIVDDWTSTKATLQIWERSATGWKRTGDAWSAVVGQTGAAWGIGLHGSGAPNREGPIKKEGDGKSPAGVFKINAAYGVAEDPPKDTKLAYETTAHGDWQCVDDPASDHYAEIVDRKQVPSDWQSHEELLRDDALYTWVIDIAHNPEHVPGKGSCIFFHVWGGPASTTVGCTAMDERDIKKLLGALNPADQPLYVLLPRADYAALAPTWGLPPL